MVTKLVNQLLVSKNFNLCTVQWMWQFKAKKGVKQIFGQTARDRKTDRQKDRETERQKDKETESGRELERQNDSWAVVFKLFGGGTWGC